MNTKFSQFILSRQAPRRKRLFTRPKTLMLFLVACVLIGFAAGMANAREQGIAAHNALAKTPKVSPLTAPHDAMGLVLARLVRQAESGNSQSQYIAGLLVARTGARLTAHRFDTLFDRDGFFAINAGTSQADLRKAIVRSTVHRYFRNAALQGHVGALTELAYHHEHGIGTPQNLPRAIQLYTIAAASNNAQAQFNLAIILAQKVEKPDLRLAYLWASAARNNIIRGQTNGAISFERVDRLTQMIRKRIPHQDARRAQQMVVRLTGQPV